jgi:hypothetical protein
MPDLDECQVANSIVRSAGSIRAKQSSRGGTSSYVVPASHLFEAHNSAAVADHVPLVDAALAIRARQVLSAVA